MNYDALSTEELWAIYTKDRTNIALRNILIERNLPLIYRLTTRYSRYGFSCAELLSAAAMGLIYAVEHFDPQRNVYFSTYCYPFMRGTIRIELQTKRGAISRRKAESLAAIHRAENAAFLRGEFALSVGEIAHQANVPLENVTKLLNFEKRSSTLSKIENGSTEKITSRRYPDEIEALANRELLEMALSTIPPRLREMVSRHYLDGWEFRTIGEKYGMSRQRVHQLVVKGLAQMREFLKERGIASEDIRW